MIENRKNGRVTLPGVVVTMGLGLLLRAPKSSSLSRAEGVALQVALRYSRPEELTHKHRFYISSATTQLALKCKCTFAMFHLKDTTDFVPSENSNLVDISKDNFNLHKLQCYNYNYDLIKRRFEVMGANWNWLAAGPPEL